ncbi:MAG: hypothetical protein ACI8X5_003096 [Planctomycetota bacterium]|jgi:hypothetical protein
MDPQAIILGGVLAPALAAGILLALAWKIWSTEDGSIDGRWIGAPALAAAFLATFFYLSGLPASPLPGSSRTPTGLDWLAWLVIFTAPILPIEPKFGRYRHLLRGIVAIIAVRLVLFNAFASTWNFAEGTLWTAGLSVLFLILWSVLSSQTAARPGASSPLFLWVLATGLALLSSLSGSAKIAQLSGALAAGLGAATVIAWRVPRLSLSGAGTALALLILFGLSLNAHFYSYTTGVDILLFASAPFLALLTKLPRIRRMSDARQTLFLVFITALPIAIAIGHATIKFMEAADEYDY